MTEYRAKISVNLVTFFVTRLCPDEAIGEFNNSGSRFLELKVKDNRATRQSTVHDPNLVRQFRRRLSCRW